MMNTTRDITRQQIALARQEMEEARAGGDAGQISLAAANLGLAFFQANKFKDGAKCFREADAAAKELDDFNVLVRCWGIKTAAYQITEQHPRAYQTAQDILELAKEKGDLGVQADSLATQGQILIDSGDEVDALARFNAALAIAEKLGDKRRQMNIMGAFGNYCLVVASGDRAGYYFEKARALARELGDRTAEIGFHGNLGMLLEWKEEYRQAGRIFAEVLDYMRETGNQEAQIQALRHLIQVQTKLKDDHQVIHYARQGMDVTEETGNDHFFFFENLIATLYRQNQFDEAHQVTTEAIEAARLANDRAREVDLLLSLGESYMLTHKLEQALDSYQQALVGTQRLQRMVDRAYVLGRIGLILAELNRADEAFSYHEQAVELARKQNIPDLEGEQWAMLAVAYLEKGNLETARECAATAVHLYTNINHTDKAGKAQQLLDEINSAMNKQTDNGGSF
jgi:tetratricopeptide (TPR) repeat protein